MSPSKFCVVVIVFSMTSPVCDQNREMRQVLWSQTLCWSTRAVIFLDNWNLKPQVSNLVENKRVEVIVAQSRIP